MIKNIFYFLKEIALLPLILSVAILSRYTDKKIDVGLGPQPLINNIYHKKALEKFGYKAETFTVKSYFITDNFDIILSKKYNMRTISGYLKAQIHLALIPFQYKILYFYFNGGAFGQTLLLWRIEPFLYKIANIKTVVMPYGSDVQVMERSKNHEFKHVMTRDYPNHKNNQKKIAQKINLWTRYADHVISGCEWVDYMHHWDTLMVAHFSIDPDITVKPTPSKTKKEQPFRILHAPNHRAIKGTDFLINAVNNLKKNGLNIELKLLEKVSNETVIEEIHNADLIADQFIIGWYAMFAIEAMKHQKPVLCYLRDDLIKLYQSANLIKPDEIPIINCHWSEIEEKIKYAYDNRTDLKKIGKESRNYIIKHHSIDYVGGVFDAINKDLLEV